MVRNMKLSKCQEITVNELVSKFNPLQKNIIDFQAPTGSGKTFMITNMIDRLISKFPNEKLTFVIATLSSANLPKQMLDNLNDYKKYLHNNFITIERKESPSTKDSKVKDGHYQIMAKRNNILILGTQSFGKGRIFTEEGTINSFINQIKSENYKLIYIRDEAHYGGEAKKENNKFLDYSLEENLSKQLSKTKDESKKFELLMQDAAHFIVKMTATPRGKNDLVLLNEKDLEEDNIILLKKVSKYNEGIDSLKSEEISNNDILELACKKFKEVKNRYANYQEEPFLQNINPAMLIQVRDDYKNKHEEFEKEINNIISILNKNGLTWVKYFGSNDVDSSIRLINNSLRSISRNHSDIDVIIFKIGPATGWNIPRACMLVQLRNVSSDSLNTQTLGRIKRNPNPEADYSNSSIALNYYYYSNIQESSRQRITLVLKNEFKDEKFKVGSIDRFEIEKRVNNPKYLEDLISLLDINELNAEFNRYYNYYKKYKFIVVGEENYGNKKLITTKIQNNIELEIYKENFLLENKTYFSKNIILAIEKWFFTCKRGNRLHDLISVNLMWLIISISKMEQIKSKFSEIINSSKIESKIYKISEKSLPYNNDLLVKENSKEMDIPDAKYAYENLRSKKENSNINYFDSKVETKFLSLLKDYIINNDQNYKIKIWTKNPVFHGLFLEYFDDDNNVSKSFPDFIIKISLNNESKQEHIFYIETKDSNDKSIKISNILKGYKKYFDDKNVPLFDQFSNENLTLIVAKVNQKEKNSINFQGSSSIKNVEKLLNENKEKEKPITFLIDLFNSI